jgi:hypothetical protein
MIEVLEPRAVQEELAGIGVELAGRYASPDDRRGRDAVDIAGPVCNDVSSPRCALHGISTLIG